MKLIAASAFSTNNPYSLFESFQTNVEPSFLAISRSEFIANSLPLTGEYSFGGGLIIGKGRDNIGHDGVVIPYKDVDILIDLSNFTANKAYYAAGIYFAACTGVVRRCRFSANQAPFGASDIAQTDLLDINDIKKPMNISLSYFDYGLGSSIFDPRGGSIRLISLGQHEAIDHLDADSYPTIPFEDSNNTKFMGAWAKIDRCTHVAASSQIAKRGSAIFVRNDKSLELTHSTFSGGTSTIYGGVLYA